MEVEPNPKDMPQTLPDLPLAIDGNVTSDNADWFSVELPAASALQVTIVEGDVDWVEFGGSAGGPKCGLAVGVGSTRQFFVPATDTCQIGVVSAGDPFNYRIRLDVVTDLVATPPDGRCCYRRCARRRPDPGVVLDWPQERG